MKFTVGTRGSALAIKQTESVVDLLRSRYPQLDAMIRTIRTEGDIRTDRPLAEIGGKGVFVKEIESALDRGEIDLAVHSLKDVPAQLPAGLTLGAILPRADARDVLVSRDGRKLRDLRNGAVVATGSERRRIQLRALRPDLEVRPIRGNVDTRLRKLDEGQFDALVLAAAGLSRLGHIHRVTEYLEPDVMLPAVGQGVLALELRVDSSFLPMIAALDHYETRIAVTAERAFLGRLGAGCQLPVAAQARLDGERLSIAALIGRDDGSFVRLEISGATSQAEELGRRVAETLIEQTQTSREGAHGTRG